MDDDDEETLAFMSGSMRQIAQMNIMCLIWSLNAGDRCRQQIDACIAPLLGGCLNLYLRLEAAVRNVDGGVARRS